MTTSKDLNQSIWGITNNHVLTCEIHFGENVTVVQNWTEAVFNTIQVPCPVYGCFHFLYPIPKVQIQGKSVFKINT